MSSGTPLHSTLIHNGRKPPIIATMTLDFRVSNFDSYLGRVAPRSKSCHLPQSRCGSKYVNPANASHWVDVLVSP